ncbi:aldehyde dehydrogenase family protein [Actinopolyspora mortivallis]|uniref:aldehyde dehydrogenase family protein n=1 Tax=Actinopolyspora mortivallis TaxID=33906 RepID=UPI0003822876|nr:aldehyde dehydrogenase family protein [Actinopolyspora mortivallis]
MHTGYWVAGTYRTGEESFAVTSPWDGATAGTAYWATEDDVERAVAAAHVGARRTATLPAHSRADALDHVRSLLRQRSEEFAELITAESGKPLFWSRAEVNRAVSTFGWAAEEARRWSGRMQRLDTEPGTEGRLALVRGVPRGPVLGISPFNFPLNLAVHKLAPALAVGAPIVLKPAPKTPLTVLRLGELLAETELPAGAWSLVPVADTKAAELVADPRLPVVSFTGSGPVGWGIRDSAPRKHVTLELGGNAAVYVHRDWTDTDYAAERIATFAMYQAGQSCVSVQRVFVHRELYEDVLPRLVKAVESQGSGDPRAEDTRVGPLIDREAAERVQHWVDEAVRAGARVLTGGVRHGSTYEPTVLTGVPPQEKVVAEEVFGPVMVVEPVESEREAFERINDSRYGLQAGIFTRDVGLAFRASSELEVGGVIVGDVPSFRADQMPYGGVKESGVGREGVRAAMTDLTEERVTVLTGVLP